MRTYQSTLNLHPVADAEYVLLRLFEWVGVVFIAEIQMLMEGAG